MDDKIPYQALFEAVQAQDNCELSKLMWRVNGPLHAQRVQGPWVAR